MNRKKQLLGWVLTVLMVFTSVPAMGLFAAEYDSKVDVIEQSDTLEVRDIIKHTGLFEGKTLKVDYWQEYDYDEPSHTVKVDKGVDHTILDAAGAGIEIPEGMKLKNWKVAYIYESSGENAYISLTPNWEVVYKVKYNLTNIEVVGDKPLEVTSDQAITLTLKAKPSYRLPESVSVEIDGHSSPVYTYTPNTDGTATLSITGKEGDITITAAGVLIPTPPAPSNPGGGGGGGGTTPTPKQQEPEGGRDVIVGPKEIEKMIADSGTDKIVEIKVKSDQGFSATFPKASLDALVGAKIKELIISTGAETMKFDIETLKKIQSKVGDEVKISAVKVDNDTLSDEAKAVVGNRPVYDLSITGKNGEKVTDFGEGKVFVSIPYTLTTNEKAEDIVAYYIDDKGKVHEIRNSIYDQKTEALSFVTNHFSQFAVGERTKVTFIGIIGHWAQDDIEFTATRGLFYGTAEDIFSPNMPITRGMFVTVIGRLVNADLSSYKESSFADVKSEAYYMPSIEWAKENKIVNGMSDTEFAPGQAINREQMAAIMVNLLKGAGFEILQIEDEKVFADNEMISDYAKVSVKEMQMAGLLGGREDGIFDPKGTTTRAEASAVVRRLMRFFEQN